MTKTTKINPLNHLLSSTEISAKLVSYSHAMSLLINSMNSTPLSNLKYLSFLNSFPLKLSQSSRKSFPIRVSPINFTIFQQLNKGDEIIDNNSSNQSEDSSITQQKKRLSEQSSWETKDSRGNDYLYRLGAEADNMNIAVGAKSGVIDELFAGNFLGRDSDIVFTIDRRSQGRLNTCKAITTSLPYFWIKLVSCPEQSNDSIFSDDFFIHICDRFFWGWHVPPWLLRRSAICHIVKNFIAHHRKAKVPLILGIWGGKGQGKTFQTELIFRALEVEPVIISAGELESEKAGEPGKLIRERYRTASQVVQNQGKLSCLLVNDIDAGIGRFGDTQVTVNNQIVSGTLMNLADNPTRVSTGQKWRESDVTHRIPIIVTGNDFSTIYAPLIRDGRMEKFYWQPNHEDIVNIVHRMYEKDGISKDEVLCIVNTFPNQALDFYGALRSRTYDRSLLKWVDECGGVENLGTTLFKQRRGDKLPVFVPPEQNVEALLESGYSLVKEQQFVMQNKLSKEYMKNIDE